jgi:hypothetical protein
MLVVLVVLVVRAGHDPSNPFWGLEPASCPLGLGRIPARRACSSVRIEQFTVDHPTSEQTGLAPVTLDRDACP